MQLLINPADDAPIYRQIVRQVAEAIASGRMKPGEKVPSHRELSEQIVVAPLTVKRAYDELESLGYLETRRGRGTFVCATPPVPGRKDQMEKIQSEARRLLSEAAVAGLRLEDLIDIVRGASAARQEEEQS
jgi:GntR family transcriptional regulator